MYWQTREFEISGYDKCKTCRKNVKFCYCVCFSSGYKVHSGLIQIQFNPLTLPETIDYLLLKKRNVKKNFIFFIFILKQVISLKWYLPPKNYIR